MLKLIVIGNIGQNAKITNHNGRNAISFSIAHNKKYSNADGVEVNTTTWVNCTYWRAANQSTEVAKYLTAGTKVCAVGQPELRQYKTREGQPAASLDLAVTEIELLGTGNTKADPDTDPEPDNRPIKPLNKTHHGKTSPEPDPLPY